TTPRCSGSRSTRTRTAFASAEPLMPTGGSKHNVNKRAGVHRRPRRVPHDLSNRRRGELIRGEVHGPHALRVQGARESLHCLGARVNVFGVRITELVDM